MIVCDRCKEHKENIVNYKVRMIKEVSYVSDVECNYDFCPACYSSLVTALKTLFSDFINPPKASKFYEAKTSS